MTTQPKSFTSDGIQWAWDSTSITAASECQRRYYYKIICGWSSLGQLSKDLRFGQHYATAIEHYYKWRIVDGLDHEEALHRTVREALIDTWDHKTEPAPLTEGPDGEAIMETDKRVRIPNTGMPWESNDSIKNRWTLIRSIVWYLCHYVEDELDTTQVVSVNGRPGLELSFDLPISADITFCGHLDRLASDERGIFVMDQKTTGGALSPQYFRNFDRSLQMSMYSLAGQVLFGAPIKGVMIDAVQIQVGGSYYMRGETFRTETQIEEWIRETEDVIKRTQDNTAADFFPRDTTACGYYGGCEFKEICGMCPSLRERFLKGGFDRRERWDPIERR